MALDFPANPTDGQVYGAYIYNATVGAWQSIEESAPLTVSSPVAPTSANPGDLWYNTSNGILFHYYADGTSSQWVEVLSSNTLAIDGKANLSGGNSFTGTQTFNTPISVPSGGTGVNTLTSGAYLKGNGTSSITAQTGIPAGDVTSGTLGYDRIPVGTVIQTTNTKYTPLVTTGSTSFVNFTSVNFTPKKSNSLILIQAMFSTSNGGAVQVRNTGGTVLFSPINAFHVFAGVGGPDYGASTIRIPYYLQCTDLPGTTATRTYYFDFRVYSGTFAINEGGSGVSSITIMEVAQ